MEGKRIGKYALLGGCAGIYYAFLYINPYGGKIGLSELILQLSGNRADFPPGFYAGGLLNLMMVLLPVYVCSAYAGVELYRHYCTASVFIFSRIEKRLSWYIPCVLKILCYAILFEVTAVITAAGISLIRHTVTMDSGSLYLCLMHILIHGLYLFILAMLVNFAAIRFGSSRSYIAVISVQMAFTTLLLIHKDDHLLDLVKYNPMANLIISWHIADIQVMQNGMDLIPFAFSILYFTAIALLISVIGAVIVRKHDLIVNDMEEL